MNKTDRYQYSSIGTMSKGPKQNVSQAKGGVL